MNGHDFPEQFDPDPFPDPEQYNEYLDGLRRDRIQKIDDDLTAMFEADQRQSAATRAFLESMEAALVAIEKVLKS